MSHDKVLKIFSCIDYNKGKNFLIGENDVPPITYILHGMVLIIKCNQQHEVDMLTILPVVFHALFSKSIVW